MSTRGSVESAAPSAAGAASYARKGSPERRTVGILLSIAALITLIFYAAGLHFGYLTPLEKLVSPPYAALCLLVGVFAQFAPKGASRKAVVFFKVACGLGFLALLVEGIYRPQSNIEFHFVWYPLFLASLIFGTKSQAERSFGLLFFFLFMALTVLAFVLTPRVVQEREVLFWVCAFAANGMLLLFLRLVARDMSSRANLEAELRLSKWQADEERQKAALIAENLKEAEQAKLEAIKQKGKAEAADQAKTAFLANMSHELRTPLNSIIGFTELMMLKDGDSENKGQNQDYLKTIHTSGQHLLSVINDLLDLAKYTSGKMALTIKPFDFSVLLEDVATSLASISLGKNHAVTLDLLQDPVQLNADQRLIKQLLINLIGNAIKFTPEGGSIAISSRLTDTRDMEVIIKDTGIGIKPEQMKQVMQPFFQGDMSYRKTFEGTGLGLAIVQSVCQLHESKLSITSQPGEGTTVSILFQRERLIFEPVELKQVETSSQEAETKSAVA